MFPCSYYVVTAVLDYFTVPCSCCVVMVAISSLHISLLLIRYYVVIMAKLDYVTHFLVLVTLLRYYSCSRGLCRRFLILVLLIITAEFGYFISLTRLYTAVSRKVVLQSVKNLRDIVKRYYG